jgi:hypothetical protein
MDNKTFNNIIKQIYKKYEKYQINSIIIPIPFNGKFLVKYEYLDHSDTHHGYANSKLVSEIDEFLVI